MGLPSGHTLDNLSLFLASHLQRFVTWFKTGLSLVENLLYLLAVWGWLKLGIMNHMACRWLHCILLRKVPNPIICYLAYYTICPLGLDFNYKTSIYCMSKKSCPYLCSISLCADGHNFLDIQYACYRILVKT